MTVPQDCPNYEKNVGMCPCTETSCERRGICCECMLFHSKSDQWPLTACARMPRTEATIGLSMVTEPKCGNFERNLEVCPCTSEDCERQGTCCDCVRNHWKTDGSGRTACMRGR